MAGCGSSTTISLIFVGLHQKCEVQRWCAVCCGRDVLGEGFPVPGDPFFQDAVGNGFDVDEISHGDFAGFRPTRGYADPTVAHDHARDPMPGRRRHRAVPANLCIVVGVWVDESGGYNGAVGIDNFRCQAIDIADRRNLSIADCDVAASRRVACAVDQRSVLD